MRKLLVGAGWAVAVVAGLAVSGLILFGVVADYADLSGAGGGYVLAGVAINAAFLGVLFWFNS